VGVGISDTLTTPLRISNPDTIIGNIWVQAAFKIDAGEKLGGLNFYSGSVRYPLPGPTSVHSFIAVYERDVPVSDVITVSVNNPLDEEKARALTAYFLRRTREGHGLVGYTMCQSLYRDSYSDVLKLPLSVNSGDITVTAVIVDNNHPDGVVRFAAQAGDVSQEITFTKPSHGNSLDIRELRLSDVLTSVNEITVVVQSPTDVQPPFHSESLGLVGLAADTYWPALRVSNKATVCENVGTGTWCWHDIYINTDGIYLPIVLKDGL
jgi:hypothetical protein